MSRKLFALFLVAAGMIHAASAFAQSDDKPTPKAPFIAPVPDYGHWLVTFKYSADPDKTDDKTKPPAVPNGYPVTIDTIKSDEMKSVVLTFADGKSKQFTCRGDWIMTSTAKGPQLSIASPSSQPFMFYTAGFILLDKVSLNASNFQGAETHNGVLTFHYKSGDVEAWVDRTTMLPVGAKENSVEVSYQFMTPPPKPFPIPEDQSALLKKEQSAYQATRALR